MSEVQYNSITGMCKDMFPSDKYDKVIPNSCPQIVQNGIEDVMIITQNIDYSPVYGYVASVALTTLSYNALRYVRVRPLTAGIVVVTTASVANCCYLINTDNICGYVGGAIGITAFGTLAYLFNSD